MKLGIGALLGATVFDTQFICGTIAFICGDIQIARRPLLRDCIYLSCTAAMVLYICWNGKIEYFVSIIIISFYVLYVIFVYCSSKIRKCWRIKHGLPISSKPIMSVKQKRKNKPSYSEILSQTRSGRNNFIKNIISKQPKIVFIILKIILFPITLASFLFKITISLPDDEHWNDYLAVIHCITAPLLICFAFELFELYYYWLSPMIFGAIMSILTFISIKFRNDKIKTIFNEIGEKTLIKSRLVSSNQKSYKNSNKNEEEYGTVTKELSSIQHPSKTSKYSHKLPEYTITNNTDSKQKQNQPVLIGFFLLLSFIVSISWIMMIAEELVSILTVLGIVSGIDLTILGLTVLAWGNATPDLINNISVARKGYATMAIGASLGGTSMDINLGVGIGTLIGTLNANNLPYLMPNSSNIFIGCLFIIFGCIQWIVIVGINKCKLNKIFGITAYIHYLLFLLINILLYTNVITLNFVQET